jgi:Glycosyl transferase family 2
MRVNIVSTHRNQTGLALDVDILQGIWASLDKDIQFRRVLNAQPECPEAEINVFMEVLNPSLFTYARKNIFIPNPEWTYKTWNTYLSCMDEIWVKTREAEELFKEIHPNVRYIGWTSIAKGTSIKNFHKAVYLAGKNIYRHPQIILDAYKSHPQLDKLPELHLIYDSSRMKLTIPDELSHKVKEYKNTLKSGQYNEILQDCGLAICISGAEGFGHAVNEAASTSSIFILNEIEPFKEFEYPGTIFCKNSQKVPHPECLGDIWKTEISDLQDALTKYIELPLKKKKKLSEENESHYRMRHNAWIERMKSLLSNLTSQEEYRIADGLPKEEDLPGVTIVTPTKDRLKFMEICAGCVESQCYPQDKLEWLVIDDGKDTCEDFIKHIPFARHILEMPGKTIAWKRNRACELAKYDIIIHMDDDDIYPPNSILFRVSMMLRAQKQVAFCSTLPSYDIANYISFVNVPPMRLPQNMRISEATLCHTKKFWNDGKFPDDIKIAEGSSFLKGREHLCIELSPQEIIVSLVHPRTTSSRRAPSGMEPNGCHFGFTEELFQMLSELGEYLKHR